MAENRFDLAHWQINTPGLYTGDPLKIDIGWVVNCSGVLCFGGWWTLIDATTNSGQRSTRVKNLSSGRWSDTLDIAHLVFGGTMPSHDIEVTVKFTCYIVNIAPQEIVVSFNFPNLDDVSPEPPPDDGEPGYCTEGQTKCVGEDLMVCSNSKWIVKEKNAFECGYVPPECFDGTTRCVGTTLQRCVGERWKTTKTNAVECGYVPPPPPDDGDLPPEDEIKTFWDEYKWWIIGGLAIIAVAAVVITKPWQRGK